MEGLVKAPMINVATILAEVELFKEWIPITPISEMIKELSPLRKSLYLRNEL